MATPIQTQQHIDVQIAQLERQVLELKRQRNRLSPILAIPPELFCQILLLATSYPRDEEDFKHLQESFRVQGCIGTLCHVSHSWRMTALCCPQLWAEIDIRTETDQQQVDFMLDHAHTLPISLHIDAEAPELTTRQYGQLKALDSILRVLSKGVPFAKLALTGNINVLTELLRNTQPTTLEALRLVVSDNDNDNGRLGYTAAGASIAQHPLFTRGAPKLRALTIEGCAIPLASPILLQSQQLTTLSICIPRGSHPAHVMDVLKAIQLVRRLKFDFRGALTPSHVSLDPVHLPYLSRILLRGDSESVLTTFSNLRLSATPLSIGLFCEFRDRSHMPAYGPLLFRAISQARCPPEYLRNIIPPDEPFSPELVVLGEPHPSPYFDSDCFFMMHNWGSRGGASSGRGAAQRPSDTGVSAVFFDQRASRSVPWAEWHPLVLAKHPRDLQLSTGWSVERLVMVGFFDRDANYPEPFLGLLSKCPRISELAILPVHMLKLVPHLFADNGDIPFPSLYRIAVQGAPPSDTSPGAEEKYESQLEILLEGLRKRRKLCKKYGLSKTWILETLSLGGHVAAPDPVLLHAAGVEGLIGRFS